MHVRASDLHEHAGLSGGVDTGSDRSRDAPPPAPAPVATAPAVPLISTAAAAAAAAATAAAAIAATAAAATEAAGSTSPPDAAMAAPAASTTSSDRNDVDESDNDEHATAAAERRPRRRVAEGGIEVDIEPAEATWQGEAAGHLSVLPPSASAKRLKTTRPGAAADVAVPRVSADQLRQLLGPAEAESEYELVTVTVARRGEVVLESELRVSADALARVGATR
jgi:hypothetical protein